MSALAALPSYGSLSLPASGGGLTRRQKAAVIVQVILSQGATLRIADLPDDMQSELAEEMGRMRAIDRDTLHSVAEEFANEVEAIGLSFPGGMSGALTLLDGHLSPAAANRLRRMFGTTSRADAWERISGLDAARLLPVLESESIEVGAVILSKLAVAKAAEILGKLPGEKARKIAYAVSLTSAIDPETVRRIGHALALQLDAQPARAFASDPVERVGAILNFSPANTRDEVLKGLDEEDAAFADQVRKAIFTFTNIPIRIDTRDIPKILRNVDQVVLVTALAGAKGENEKSAEFILANISQRMAGNLRDEMANLGKVKDKDAEVAMSAVIAQIREMEAAGEIFLVAGEDPDE